LILLMVLTILLISLTVALPDVYTAGQREREEELIFRGNEYARAILFYRRQFNHYPTSVKELVKKTNGFRFLRHAYTDPMTRSGKWRFIHANAAGVVIDSKILAPPQVSNPAGKVSGASSSSSDNQQASNETTQSPSSLPGPSGPSGASGSSDNEVKGAFIVGVASTSKHKSIRIRDNHDRYDEWEFMGILKTPTSAADIRPGKPFTTGESGSQTPETPAGPVNTTTPPQQ
jgi:type II secretory pathway pseudopilin PulG